MKKISFIIPAHNEADNIAWHYKEVSSFLQKESISYEIYYINDGSQDDTLAEIKKIAQKNLAVHYLSLSRNFGKEAALSAGLQACSGAAAIFVDADGQFPIQIIKTFLKKWEDGNEVVIGVRRSNKGEGIIKRYGSKLFYKILNILTNDKTIPGSTDFRLIDRKVIDEFNRLTERTRITRGLIDWLGFKRELVYFDAEERKHGRAAYGFRKLFQLALSAFVSNSTKPLKIVGLIGIAVTFLSGASGIILLLEKYLLSDPLKLAVTGTALLAIFLSFLIGIVLGCQGLLALYIESIHNETQNRPLYIIAEKG